MRKIYVCMMFLFLGLSLSAQTQTREIKFKKHQVDKLIKEVYKDKAEAIILSDETRYEGFQNLLLNRISIYKQPYKEGESYQKLSDIELLATYNSNLSRDFSFNLNNFNPLKYQISLFSNEIVVYRIDQQHILYIKPQKTNKK